MNTQRRPPAWLTIMRLGPRLLPAILLTGVLAGCGQKGPLHLPDEIPVATQQKSGAP